ncbi:hypothetical protein [Paraclostridium dentum]|uniref:hypothetical protein n=1 Tax=Paraclostridium dentum TaxID=2662455 RepID=UPI003F2DA933
MKWFADVVAQAKRIFIEYKELESMFHIEIGNVEGRGYKEFIDLVTSLSDKFLLVERNDMSSSDNLINVLKKLESSLIDMKEQSEWPSAMLTESIAKVYYYKIDDNSKNVLKEEVDSLFSWEQPELPEDLCFINGDESWISTSSHEGYCDIISEDEDIIDSILRIKGVEKRFC